MKRLLLIAVLMAGCCNGSTERREEKKEFIRIFMNYPGQYSILVKDGNELKAEYSWGVRQKLFCDVAMGEPMYYKIIYKGNSREYIEFHIHKVQEVNGAATGGKSVTQTHVIE